MQKNPAFLTAPDGNFQRAQKRAKARFFAYFSHHRVRILTLDSRWARGAESSGGKQTRKYAILTEL